MAAILHQREQLGQRAPGALEQLVRVGWVNAIESCCPLASLNSSPVGWIVEY